MIRTTIINRNLKSIIMNDANRMKKSIRNKMNPLLCQNEIMVSVLDNPKSNEHYFITEKRLVILGYRTNTISIFLSKIIATECDSSKMIIHTAYKGFYLHFDPESPEDMRFIGAVTEGILNMQ